MSFHIYFKSLLILLSLSLISGCASQSQTNEDPYLWLEEVEGTKALQWTKDQNKITNKKLSHSKRFKEMKDFSHETLQSSESIPKLKILGDYYYTLWRNKKNPKGLWKRTEISKRLGKIESWETVLDIDRLAEKEKKEWVFTGYKCLKPSNTLCLIKLAPGGTDAGVYREFNTKTKKFVKDGFVIPEAKTEVAWIDRHHLAVATNFGKESLTDSGYGRLGKIWRRGTPLNQAKTILEVPKTHIEVAFSQYTDKNKNYVIGFLVEEFWKDQFYILGKNYQKKISIPNSSRIFDFFENQLIFELREDWKGKDFKFKKGQVLALNTESFGKKVNKEHLKTVYTPEPKTSILEVVTLKNYLVFNILKNVKTKLQKISYNKDQFKTEPLELRTTNSVIDLVDTSSKNNILLFKAENFLKPSRLYIYDANSNKRSLLKSLKNKFDSQGMVVKQNWVTSKDGTQVPYFLVGKKEVIKKGSAPTILYGYGGFQINILPKYDSELGKNWLERGGLYALANIRGGGEFGVDWHRSALKKKRQKAYDDFIAVAEDLIKSKVTTNKKLGIRGRSNGGLLVAAVMVQRPDLFGAVSSIVPLIDMVRYSHLLAGASWMSEYGNPDIPKERAYILKYSPYQNVKKTKDFPATFLYTSQKDDRVHPGHARKMAHKMQDLGIEDVYYFENQRGGHKTTVNLDEEAHWHSLIYEFFHTHLFN